MRSNFPLALLGGALAAIIGASIWEGFKFATVPGDEILAPAS